MFLFCSSLSLSLKQFLQTHKSLWEFWLTIPLLFHLYIWISYNKFPRLYFCSLGCSSIQVFCGLYNHFSYKHKTRSAAILIEQTVWNRNICPTGFWGGGDGAGLLFGNFSNHYERCKVCFCSTNTVVEKLKTS